MIEPLIAKYGWKENSSVLKIHREMKFNPLAARSFDFGEYAFAQD